MGFDLDETREQPSDLPVILFDNVCKDYKGDVHAVNNVSFRVEKGEFVSIIGQSGSGKSTLLSLVCADNLQSYACDITLFGRRRGTGESIWEIKKHLRYIKAQI